MSNYLAQKRLVLVLDWSVATGDLEPPKRVSEILPCRTFAQAGLRWCGGWRRANLRGSHDQGQIPTKGLVPLSRPNDPQIRIPKATSTGFIEASRAV